MNKLTDYINDCCQKFGQKQALVCGKSAVTYSELSTLIADFTLKLKRLEIPNRSLIGIMLPNSIEYVALHYAVMNVGCVPVLIDTQFRQRELEYLHRQNIRRLITKKCVEPFVEQSALLVDGNINLYQSHAQKDVSENEVLDSTVLCRLTSGTTGNPKILEFSADAVMCAATSWSQGTSVHEGSSILTFSALSNGLSYNTSLLALFMKGGTLHLWSGILIPSAVANYVKTHQINRLVAFPAFYKMLLDTSPNLLMGMRLIKEFISSGSKLEASIRNKLESDFGIILIDYYGIAEAGPVTYGKGYKEGVGAALPGCDIKVDEDGKLFVKTASFASRYLNFPELYQQRVGDDGFLNTGDCGELLDSGSLQIKIRESDKVIINGRNIDISEVSEVAKEIEDVKDAAIIIKRSKDKEPSIHLFLESMRPYSRKDIYALLKSRLAEYKIPQTIQVVPKIPRNGVGKVLLQQLELES